MLKISTPNRALLSKAGRHTEYKNMDRGKMKSEGLLHNDKADEIYPY